jgi:hypothetical protein
MALFGQTITYNIPEGFESDISKEEYKKIVDLSIPIVAKRYSIDYVKDGAIQLKKEQEMETLNLHNLITKCAAVKDKSQWNKVVEAHFASLFASIDEQKKIDPEHYETVKKYLSLRIYPQETVNQRGGISSLVAHTNLEGTYTLLMFDLPGAFTPVQKELFELWKLDTTTVFQAAQDNINKQAVEKVTKTIDFDGVKIEISFLGNEDYAASYALGLNDNSPELVESGDLWWLCPTKALLTFAK